VIGLLVGNLCKFCVCYMYLGRGIKNTIGKLLTLDYFDMYAYSSFDDTCIYRGELCK
jgi:hypothetical protein